RRHTRSKRDWSSDVCSSDLHRVLSEKLSNGDENAVEVSIKNNYPFKINAKTIDELPFQFQKRDFLIERNIDSKKDIAFEYILEQIGRASRRERGEMTDEDGE